MGVGVTPATSSGPHLDLFHGLVAVGRPVPGAFDLHSLATGLAPDLHLPAGAILAAAVTVAGVATVSGVIATRGGPRSVASDAGLATLG